MADFVPVSFTKDGVTEIADTRAEYVQYVYDGWTIGDVAPVFPHGVRSITINNIEIVTGGFLPSTNPSPEGTLYVTVAGVTGDVDSGYDIVDNGDGTFTALDVLAIDNGDGTFTI